MAGQGARSSLEFASGAGLGSWGGLKLMLGRDLEEIH